eukprot:CAMPEP_0201728936 /NCGR_PEP_ID=MMETSP0593-20130828/17483_1 /ASSEMBLY_ACC=CAM_ASM_000672 /TAXON_ID=267983 /ORGANISM="Skeletonema japonicum, Strain CCMP2506" /LENGTH=602 /DNA_ID=CAMNT_0048221179 /DNA_START=265 /DNA_END=2073 /DNA_ORIENTATION=-
MDSVRDENEMSGFPEFDLLDRTDANDKKLREKKAKPGDASAEIDLDLENEMEEIKLGGSVGDYHNEITTVAGQYSVERSDADLLKLMTIPLDLKRRNAIKCKNNTAYTKMILGNQSYEIGGIQCMQKTGNSGGTNMEKKVHLTSQTRRDVHRRTSSPRNTHSQKKCSKSCFRNEERLKGLSLSALIAICISCWYISSNFNAIASQVLFSKVDLSERQDQILLLAQLLTTLQLVLGTVFSITFFACRRLLYGKTRGSTMNIFHKKVRVFDLFIGILHYVGSMCTNMGYAYGSASLVQCVKLLEPIETLILMVLAIFVRDSILSRSWDTTKHEIQQFVSVRKVLSTFVVVGGTTLLLVQKSLEPNPKSIIFAVVSGFCMASRNVLKKTTSSISSDSRGERHEESSQTSSTKSDSGGGRNEESSHGAFVVGVQSFTFITTMAAIPAVVTTLVWYIPKFSSLNSIVSYLLKSENDALADLGRAVVFHCLFNVFSITVLSLTSATTHSLMNVGKRIVNVLTAAAYFGVKLSVLGKAGISLAAVGAFIYNDSFTEILKSSSLGKYLARYRREHELESEEESDDSDDGMRGGILLMYAGKVSMMGTNVV